MKSSIRNRLETVRERFEELSGLLSDPDVISNQNKFRDLSREYSKLEPVVGLFKKFESIDEDIVAAEELAGDSDDDIRTMVQEELASLTEGRDELLLDLQKALIPPDPRDDNNVYLEIRAGTGFEDSAIFVGDLFRMYSK